MSPVIRKPRRPVLKRLPRVRRSIWTLEASNTWDPYTLAYAKAVAAMKQRPASDKTSWEFQAGIHGTSCQHQTWFFLPWHRMYILWFERIVQALVAQQPGAPKDWALPYWNWQANRVLPPAFREQNLPASAGGGPNPLFVQNRNAPINNGSAMAAAIVDSTVADAKIAFTEGAGSGFGFGGGDTQGPSHFGGGQTGRIESQPHNNVHNTIGGTMATALSSRDPIFWLHHSMVDRMWVKWLAKGGGRANPSASSWLNQQFTLTNKDGQPVTMKPADVLSTVALGYRYDDQPLFRLPLSAIARPLADASLESMDAVGGGGNPEEVGASSQPIKLGAGATTESIELAQTPAADFKLLESADSGPRSVALVLEDIDTDDPATPTYEVYLNVPDEVEGGQHESPHFVGFLEFFGADHAHTEGDEGDEHAEHSHGTLTRTFDITSLVYQLEQEGAWDPSQVQVSFVPAKVFEDVETGELLDAPLGEKPPSVTVGRVRVVSE